MPRARSAAGIDRLSAESSTLSPEQIEILLRQVRGDVDLP